MRAQYLIIILLTLTALSGCGRGANPEQQQADSLLIVAREKFATGNYRESREQLAASLALNNRLNRPQKIAEAQRLLGDIAATAAQYDSSLSFYARAVEQYRSLANRETIHSLTLQMADIHHWISEDRKAFSMYTEALRLAKVFEDPVAVRETEWAMLPVCRALDNRDEETRILTELLNDATASGSQRMQANASFEAGLSSLYRSDHVAAEESLLRALTLADQSRDSLLAIRVLLKLAMTYASAGRTAEAFQMYTDGLKRSDVTSGAQRLREEMLIRVGNIYLRDKQNSQAGLFYRTALNSAFSTHNKVSEGYLTIQLAHVAESSADAVNAYRSALDLFSSFSYLQGSAYALVSLGVAAQRRNQFSDALSYFKSAVEQLEASVLRRDRNDLYAECESSFFQQPQSVYEVLADLLLQSGRYDEAFWYLERRKGRETFGDLGSLDVSTRNSDLTKEFARFSHSKALQLGAERQRERLMLTTPQHYEMLHEVEVSLTGATGEMNIAAERIVQKDKAFAPMLTIRSLGIAEVQAALPPGVVLVTHFPSARSAYSFAISNTKMAVQVAAVDRGRVLSQTQEFTDLLRTREAWKDSASQVKKLDRRIEELSSTLYGIFVRPIERDIAGATKLIVIPQEERSLLPMHALRASSGRTRTRTPYLVEQYAVSYLPSATGLLYKGKGTRSANYDIVAMGHPGETSWDVEYELRDIRAFYKDARLYFDQQATIAGLQNEHGDILHLAAEVRYNNLTPANSALVLSDGKSVSTTKQILLGELFSLPSFPTVILSNLGNPFFGGEQHISQILLTNGSSAIITNTYPPARKTKKFFGEIFYTALLGGATPAAAFRQTQLEMIKNREYSSPHLWAPFELWGR